MNRQAYISACPINKHFPVESMGEMPSSRRFRVAVCAAGNYFGLRFIRTIKQKPPMSAGHGLRRGALAVMKNAVTASSTPATIRSQPKARICRTIRCAAQSSFKRQEGHTRVRPSTREIPIWRRGISDDLFQSEMG
jgi:hypothetical protein